MGICKWDWKTRGAKGIKWLLICRDSFSLYEKWGACLNIIFSGNNRENNCHMWLINSVWICLWCHCHAPWFTFTHSSKKACLVTCEHHFSETMLNWSPVHLLSWLQPHGSAVNKNRFLIFSAFVCTGGGILCMDLYGVFHTDFCCSIIFLSSSPCCSHLQC